MKSKKLLLFAVAAAFVVATVPVAAQRHINETFAFTGETSCLFSTGGFNNDLTPKAGAVWVQSFTDGGTFVFHRDGSATFQSTEVAIAHPSASHAPSASSEAFSGSETYTIAKDGTLTVEGASFNGTFLAGSEAGSGDTITVANPPPLTGRIAVNGTIVLTSEAPTLLDSSGVPIFETLTVKNSSGATVFIFPRICHRTRVLVAEGFVLF